MSAKRQPETKNQLLISYLGCL